MKKNKQPSEIISEFLNYIEQCVSDYNYYFDQVGVEDRKLQDFLHDIEFAKTQSEQVKANTKLRQSRRARRKYKDETLLHGTIKEFFDDKQNKALLNKLKQILGQQRKQEEYLKSERQYKPRAGDTKCEK